MAQSMFKQERPNYARKTWRTVLIGAAVPFAVLAAAPAVGAAETVHTTETVNAEQLPGVPLPDPGLPAPGVPDVQALLDLQLCLADLQAALSVDVPVDVPAEAEQLPLPGDVPGLPTDVPDVAAMNETCQTVLAIVLAQTPDVPPVDPPVEVPVPDPAG